MPWRNFIHGCVRGLVRPSRSYQHYNYDNSNEDQNAIQIIFFHCAHLVVMIDIDTSDLKLPTPDIKRNVFDRHGKRLYKLNIIGIGRSLTLRTRDNK